MTAKEDSLPEYTIANHGFNGGLTEMIDLRDLEGFVDLRTIDNLARFVARLIGVVGFTAHPDFEAGTRYAHAVVWYTNLSPKNESWPLYLYDRNEAQKAARQPAQPNAIARAEKKISQKLSDANKLVTAAGEQGVKLPELDHDEQKFLALAVIRCGGSFEHTGEYSTTDCGSCRSVVPDGDPLNCGLGLKGIRHWNCCGSTSLTGNCHYWPLIKAQDEQ